MWHFLLNQKNKIFWLTLIVGIGLSVLAYFEIKRTEEKELISVFKVATTDRINLITITISDFNERLESIASIFEIFPEVSREEFANFVKPFLNKGVLAVEWAPRVSLQERKTYEKKAQEEWLPNFQFNEKNTEGNLVKAGQRAEYFPVYFLEPFENNIMAAGFDLASSAPRKETINLAIQTQSPAMTSRIILVQEMETTQKVYGVLLFAPAFQNAALPDTHESKELKGFAVGVMRIPNLFDSVLINLVYKPIDIYLFDDSAPPESSFLYFYNAEPEVKKKKEYKSLNEFPESPFIIKETIAVGGRKWTFIFQGTPQIYTTSWRPTIFFIVGLIFTSFCAIFVNFLTEQAKSDHLRSILEEEVQKRTLELKKSLELLGKTQKQLVAQEKMASLGALTAGIAHEIKNPLNFINNFSALSLKALGFLDNIIEKYDASFIEEDKKLISKNIKNLNSNLNRIEGYGKRTDAIVERMLDQARPRSNELSTIDINNLIQESYVFAYQTFRLKNPEFSIELQKEMDFSIGKLHLILGDIHSAFVNVFDNAFYTLDKKKKMLGGSFTPILSIKTTRNKDYIDITIRDNGLGIPKNIVDRLFTPFFTTKPSGEGVGLGLSFSYDIVVNEHKGIITCDTKEGEFTEFILSFPI